MNSSTSTASRPAPCSPAPAASAPSPPALTTTDLARLTDFGQHLGLAFQIVDDILDETTTPEQMGKATKKDAAKGKNTYPVLLGLEGSRTEAQTALAAALQALTPLGPAAQNLTEIARFVVDRTH